MLQPVVSINEYLKYYLWLSFSSSVCNDAALDLCFLIDASGSICDTDPSFDYDTDSTCNNWNLLLQFVRNLVDNIYDSPSVTRIGLIKFSSQAQTVFNLQRQAIYNYPILCQNLTWSEV